MNGFAKGKVEAAVSTDRLEIAPVSDLSPQEIDALVRRARSLRSTMIFDWAQSTFRTLASVFASRKPMVPRGFSRWQTLPH